MKALSIRQPWASLIIAGYQGEFKDIENRDWAAPRHIIGETIAIHSSATISEADILDAEWVLMDLFGRDQAKAQRLNKADYPLGAVLGTVRLVNCVTQSDSPWFFGRFGFVLADRVQFPEPIPAKGKLGFWNWDERRTA